MKYQLLPELSAADFEVLKQDIAARGVMVPVEYDEEGSILDGHHRVRAGTENKGMAANRQDFRLRRGKANACSSTQSGAQAPHRKTAPRLDSGRAT